MSHFHPKTQQTASNILYKTIDSLTGFMRQFRDSFGETYVSPVDPISLEPDRSRS